MGGSRIPDKVEDNNSCIVSYSKDISIKQFLTVFHFMAEMCFIVGRNGHILDVNKAFEMILGYQSDEVRGKGIEHWLPALRNQEFYSALKEAYCWSGEVWLQDKSRFYPLWIQFTPISDEDENLCSYIGMLTKLRPSVATRLYDIGSMQWDPTTELINSPAFVDKCNHFLDRCQPEEQQIAMILLDLDKFEDINIALGHKAGDFVLSAVANRLRNYLPEQSLLAHMGGDEFAILSVRSDQNCDLKDILGEMMEQVCHLHEFENHEVYISASMGISMFPQDGTIANDLIGRARLALLEAKKTRRGSWYVYHEYLSQRGKERIVLEAPLRHALEERSGLQLFYQPQIDLSSGKLNGVEALIRWKDQTLGAVSPERMIAVAESSKLIEMVGDWVLEEACQQMAKWRLSLVHFGKMAVNISIRQFYSGTLADKIATLLDKYNLPPWLLELEVTETAIEPDHDCVITTLKKIRSLGCCVAIDDFGTGYSTLHYLQHFPADVLKIDMSFVSGLPEDQANAALVRTIVTLAHNFGLRALAEGIETQQQHDFLESIDCDDGQGFFYAKPMLATHFSDWIKEYKIA